MKKIVGILCLVGVLSVCYFGYRSRTPDLTIAGYINMADGLGRQGPDLYDILHKDMNVNFLVTQKIKHAIVPAKLKKYIEKKPKKWGKVVVFEDIIWSPWGSSLKKMRGCPKDRIKIAYSMYETTRIPQEWVDLFNQNFDAIAVPSPFLVEVYEKCGVKIPVFVIPLGVKLNSYLKSPLKKECGTPFVFSNFSAASDRKNHVALIEAFHKAFGDDPSVLLRINVRYSEKEARNNITKIIASLDSPENILFTQHQLPEKKYKKAFIDTDCYVSPSKGEGFSIQPRQAMAMGIPVIVTNNTGQIPICESNIALTVDSNLPEIAVNPWGDYYGYHFNCDVDDLANALIEMRENYDSYLAKAEEAREWAKQYEYSALKPFYHSLIQPKKVVFGKENKVHKDYIETNSLRLIKKYNKQFGEEVAPVNNTTVFSHIYHSGEWGRNENGEGFSGFGSAIENAGVYMDFLQDFLKTHNIRSVVDLGCGDWTFSRYVNWDGIDYTGVDVVPFVIEKNIKEFSTANIHFIHSDGVNAKLPKADLLICKDVMQHLSTADTKALLKHAGNYSHCLFVNDVDPLTDSAENAEISSGGLRCIDLQKPPFNVKGTQVLKYNADVRKLILHVDNTKE